MVAGRAFCGTEPGATFVEIGAWCGKSTLYLGAAAEATGAVLFSVDHHHGSEENQAGWEHHEADLVDPDDGRLDTLPHWRRAVAGAGLEAQRGRGGRATRPPSPPAGGPPWRFCFIDGGHGEEPAWADFSGWAPHVAEGGWLAIHDVFADPADGGRPPYELWRAAVVVGPVGRGRRVREPAGAAPGGPAPLTPRDGGPLRPRRCSRRRPPRGSATRPGPVRAGSASPRKSPAAGVALDRASAARMIAAAV